LEIIAPAGFEHYFVQLAALLHKVGYLMMKQLGSLPADTG